MQGYQIIGLLGDSIANGYWDEEKGGWFNRLIERLKNEAPLRYTFCNMAKGGDKSIDVYHRLNAEALGREIDTLIIAVGANDIVRNQRGEYEMSSTFRQMTWERILAAAGKNFRQVAVIGMLPVIDGEIMKAGVFIYNKDIEVYNIELAKWCAIAGVKFYSPFADCRDWRDEMYADNIHPSAKGHKELERLIYQQLKIWKMI